MLSRPYRITAVLTGMFVLAIAPSSAAHGGGHVPPAFAPAAFGRPGAAQAPGPTAAPASAPGSASSSGYGGTRGKGTRSSRTGSGFTQADGDRWEFWWSHNNDRFLDLKGRLTASTNASGSLGTLTGRGRRTRADVGLRPTRAQVTQQLMPALIGILRDESQQDILDSAVLALARMAGDESVGSVVAATRPLLGNRHRGVQSSSALALGVLRSQASRGMLVALATDSVEARGLVGGGAVPREVRAFAALGLGLVGDGHDVSVLIQLVQKLDDSDRDVKASALLALSLVRENRHEAAAALRQLLGDRRLDSTLKSFIPTSLGKLGDRTAIVPLVRLLTDDQADSIVRASAAIGLGRLAGLGDHAALEALAAIVDTGRDPATRHFALMSLGRIGSEPDGVESREDRHRWLVDLFRKEILDPDHREHRAWAALAAAIYGRNHPERRPALIEAVAQRYKREKDPSVRGALVLALGLLGARQQAPAILDDFRDRSDADFRGYAAQALGFLGHRQAAPELLAFCERKGTPSAFRLNAAIGLALMEDRKASALLISMLDDEPAMAVREAATRALGLIGDRSAVQPLLDIAMDTDQADLSRAFACVALGMVAENSLFSWNTEISEDHNYLAQIDLIDAILRIM